MSGKVPLIPAVGSEGEEFPLGSWLDRPTQKYWVRDVHGVWSQLNDQMLNRFLRAEGIATIGPKGENTQADSLKRRLCHSRSVDFGGPIAGYIEGIHLCGGKRILVTESPKHIEPIEGEHLLILDLIYAILSQHCEQFHRFLLWLKCSMESLREGPPFRPGQALFLCGPAGGGKSLLQRLITVMLGGRCGKPYQYMTRATSFNQDLIGAEHVMIEDEQASADIRARRNFGASLKDMVVNEDQRLHAKGKDAIVLRPFWRVTVSTNNEPENLNILPVMDDSIRDKVMIFKTGSGFPRAPAHPAERKGFWDSLVSQIPALLHMLLTYNIRQADVDSRYGVAAWHHPEIMDVISEASPEWRLWDLICDARIAGTQAGEWQGTALELMRALEDKNSTAVRQLLRSSQSCGIYLGRLAKHSRSGHLVKASRTSSERRWIIRAGQLADG